MSKKKNQFSLPILCTAVVSASGLVTFQAKASNGSGQVSATIREAISITEASPVNFGSFNPGNTGGTIELSTVPGSGIPQVSGSVTLLGTQDYNWGSFYIRGESNSVVNFEQPNSAELISENGDKMIFSPALVATTNVSEYSINNINKAFMNNDGQGLLSAGGMLTVYPNQPAGHYTGTYTITANY